MQGREWYKPLKEACGPELKKPKFKRKKEEDPEGKILSGTHHLDLPLARSSTCMDRCLF